MKTITIIGLGNMGRAIFDCLKEAEAENCWSISGCGHEDDASAALERSDSFIIAVKPQDFGSLVDSLKVDLSGKLVISIMAGVAIKKIMEKTNSKKVVRAMPNLAVKISRGVTGWFASEEVTEEEKRIIKKIFSLMGVEFELKNESMIDSVTALSGSGTAYFFYLARLLEEKAREFGFDENQAKLLAEQTFIGAAKLVDASGKTSEEWVNAVASKGGTTEAALDSLKENGFDEVFFRAVDEAKGKSEELGRG